MAFPARFELTASGLGILRSIRLSYGNMQIDLRKYTTEGILFFTFCLVFSKVGFYLEWVKFPAARGGEFLRLVSITHAAAHKLHQLIIHNDINTVTCRFC